jgi:iron complex outermembrane receptor protein
MQTIRWLYCFTHRVPLFCGLFLAQALLASAQTTPSAPATAKAEEETIELPQFTVVSGADDGWTAASSMSGTRTNVAIKDLPRSVQVLTSEFLNDIGADTMSDAAAFMTGVTSQGKQDAVFDNNTLTLRGMRQNRHYRDGVKEGFVGMINDNASIDRIEILRGPSSLLAGVSEPGGMVNVISKRPRTRNEASVRFSLGSWDYTRAEVDVSRNLTKKLALRAVVAYQSNNTWRPFEGGERKVSYLAVAYKLSRDTTFNARAEAIDSNLTLAPAGLNIRIPTTSSATSATAAPTVGQYAFGYVPEEIAPWEFSPYGPNNSRTQDTYRVSGDVQHRFNDIFSARAFTSWSKSVRRDLRLSGSASTIIARFLDPNLGSVAGNVVGDEIRWAATKDDEKWDIWTYQADFRGAFEYWGLKHEAILGAERIESRNWRDRADTPNSSSTALGAAVSTNLNALTRYKFPTSSVGAIPLGGFQPAWTEMLDLNRYSSPNSYIDQSLVRYAFSFTNVISTKNDKWHALLGARKDHGVNSALSGTSNPTATAQALPVENATSETLGLLFRPVHSLSVYASYSTSFSGVPTGIDVYGALLTKPESGASREAGLKTSFFEDKLSFEAAVFQLDRKNARRQLSDAEVIAVLGFLPSGARSIQDNGEKSQGVEFQALYRPFKAYQIAANYSYIKTTLVAPDKPLSDGGPIAGRPRTNGSLFQKYSFQNGALKGFSLNNGVIWVDGFRPDTVSNGVVTHYMPSYVRLDFGLGYQCKLFNQPCTITASVRNAGNIKYWEGLQSKGDRRSYRVSLSTKF